MRVLVSIWTYLSLYVCLFVCFLFFSPSPYQNKNKIISFLQCFKAAKMKLKILLCTCNWTQNWHISTSHTWGCWSPFGTIFLFMFVCLFVFCFLFFSPSPYQNKNEIISFLQCFNAAKMKLKILLCTCNWTQNCTGWPQCLFLITTKIDFLCQVSYNSKCCTHRRLSSFNLNGKKPEGRMPPSRGRWP